ncbi:MAG: radical SAM/SPASM domain-containing protein [Methanosarcinaceae archaeon]
MRVKDIAANPSPGCLEIHPTLVCNLRCRYCSLRMLEQYETIGDAAAALNIQVEQISHLLNAEQIKVKDFIYQTHISTQRALKIIEEAIQLGVRHFKISGGGEPLCRPELTFALIETMINRHASVELITNGTLLKGYIDKLLKIGLNTISISMDCAAPDVLEKRRGKEGIFLLLVDAISSINTIKRERNLIYPKLQIYAVLDRESLLHISGLMAFAERNGVEKINFILRKDLETMCSLDVEPLLDLEHKYSVRTNIEDICAMTSGRDQVLRGKCHYPFDNIVVHANGLVTPCCSMKWGMGEFVQDRTIVDIWQGSLFVNTRDILNKNNLPSYCHDCKEIWN